METDYQTYEPYGDIKQTVAQAMKYNPVYLFGKYNKRRILDNALEHRTGQPYVFDCVDDHPRKLDGHFTMIAGLEEPMYFEGMLEYVIGAANFGGKVAVLFLNLDEAEIESQKIIFRFVRDKVVTTLKGEVKELQAGKRILIGATGRTRIPNPDLAARFVEIQV